MQILKETPSFSKRNFKSQFRIVKNKKQKKINKNLKLPKKLSVLKNQLLSLHH